MTSSDCGLGVRISSAVTYETGGGKCGGGGGRRDATARAPFLWRAVAEF